MMSILNCQLQCRISIADALLIKLMSDCDTFFVIFRLLFLPKCKKKSYHIHHGTYLHILNHFNLFFRSLPKLTAHEDEGVHQNPQYTGQHHFHPVVHDHDFCERVVINVSPSLKNCWKTKLDSLGYFLKTNRLKHQLFEDPNVKLWRTYVYINYKYYICSRLHII